MIIAALALGSVMLADDLLPDITIWDEKLYDTAIDTNQIPGRKLLRLSTGTPNIGWGRLEIRGGEVINSTTQRVNQRVYRTDGTFWERPAGNFLYHSGHSHIHFENWCKYRLRRVLANDGVGEVLSEGQKTSFCILDLQVHDTSNPYYNSAGFYRNCGSTVQGLTPGWADIYSKSLPDQWVDITDIPDGTYWLEAEVDPDDNLLESNETNNIGRVKVTIASPPPLGPDRFEENDTRAQVDARPEGGNNSPNFGLVNATRSYESLSVEPNDDDWFKFRMNNPGSSGDHVAITSTITTGDTDLELYDAAGNRLARSITTSNNETISLSGRPAGTYYVRVFPYSGSNPSYTLRIDPAANNVPTITVQEPAQNIWVETSIEAFRVRWQTSDADGDPVKVAVWLHRTPVTFDKNTATLVPGYEALPGADGVANVNTATLMHGQWYVYLKATDGGSFNGRFAAGSVYLYVKGDIDMNGHFDAEDMDIIVKMFRAQTGGYGGKMPEHWTLILDADRDGDFDERDFKLLKRMLNGH